MGSETTCSEYYNQEMNYYHQMESNNNRNRENEAKSESQIKEEQAQQQSQESRHQNNSSTNNNNNSWTPIQNSRPSSSSSSSAASSGWNFPSYQRFYNESHYGAGMTQNHHQIIHHSQNEQHQHQQPQIVSAAGNTLVAVTTSGNPGSDLHPPVKRYYYPGKSSNNKDICGDDKHKEDGDPWNVEAQAAFLGPNLWDKTLPYDSDLKVHQYADLDEFLSENGIPVDGLPSSHLGHSTSLGHRSDSLSHCTGLSLGLGQVTKRERSPSPSECLSPDTMNPPSPADSNEELKPQPMIKKSRKQFVPDEMKDDKYWARRRKNNMAAKRSRDARRMKENQIALRAGYLEKENMNLHREVEQLKQENMELRARLSKYQEV